MAIKWVTPLVRWDVSPVPGILPLLIVPERYGPDEMSEFKRDADEAASGLYRFAPYKDMDDRIAIGAVQATGWHAEKDDLAELRRRAKVGPKTRIAYLRRGASNGSQLPDWAMWVGAKRGGNILAHELGHQWGGLVDEYEPRQGTSWNVSQGPAGYPHWATAGCPPPYTRIKQSNSYRPQEQCHMAHGGTFVPFCPICDLRLRDMLAKLAAEVK